MNVLLVEDDENKRSQILTLLGQGQETYSIESARSLQAGVKSMQGKKPDVVLLDMTLPNYDVGPDESGGQTKPFGGRDFLRRMSWHHIRVPVIVVTQFETFGKGAEAMTLGTLDEELRAHYPDVYRGTVYYHAASSAWKDQLLTLLQRVREEYSR
jgi:CheY-like chemotaxis protein